jgi:hypothetical protein
LCPGLDSQLLENVDKIKDVCRLFIDTMSKNCHLIQPKMRPGSTFAANDGGGKKKAKT